MKNITTIIKISNLQVYISNLKKIKTKKLSGIQMQYISMYVYTSIRFF